MNIPTASKTWILLHISCF